VQSWGKHRPGGIRYDHHDVGIDLAKNVFAVHGVDQNGKLFWLNPKYRVLHFLS
jgi:hypothetical protein